MRRSLFWSTLLGCAMVAVSVLHADVKTTHKSTMKMEGFLGSMLNRMAGGADGITSDVAIKGERMSSMNGTTGQIIDLAEQKVYTLDTKKKEYTEMTFAEMREQLEKARAEMEKNQKELTAEERKALQDAADSFEFDVAVKTTGETKQLAGHPTKETILTITMRGKGKKIEESGGMVMTSTMWLAPRIAALNEVSEFYVKFFKAVYNGAFAGMSLQQMNAISAVMPGFGQLMEKMAAESRKLQGTALATTTVIERVKSPEQMAAAPKPGGGIGGMLASKFMKGSSEPRSLWMTTTNETLSVAASASADDVAIPAGFKLRKK